MTSPCANAWAAVGCSNPGARLIGYAIDVRTKRAGAIIILVCTQDRRVE